MVHTDSRAASIHDDGRKKIEIENAIEVLIGIGERFERGVYAMWELQRMYYIQELYES